jgi:DNA-binding MarR family transcriptional regulator
VFRNTADRRVRTVRLTRHGLRERKQLERDATHLVQSMFGALTEDQRLRLLAAMGEINDLLDVARDR